MLPRAEDFESSYPVGSTSPMTETGMACSLAQGLGWTETGGLGSSCGHRLWVLRL